MNNPVWIIDDDKAIRWVLEKALGRSGIGFDSFSSADDALNALYDNTPRVIISDIRMPGTDGLKFLSKVKADHPQLPVIIMTAHSDLDSAVAAFQGGAFEYLPKPFDVDQAVQLIERALAESNSQIEATGGVEAMPVLLGQAPAMQDVFRAIGRLSQSHVTVLITGESGTGKERVAEALHRHSVRSSKPFIALNTAAIPKDLLESELFGHEKGAFTGALATRRGRFEEAEGGTLFLDEIGDMPTELQTRLLRVLSDGHFYRVGGHVPIKANVRVIAATHQNLEDRVKRGLFREDLFHRLNVIRLRLPPLRERREDIPLLTRHFLAKSASSLGVEPKRLTEAAMEVIKFHSFTGNVRELENLCQWITVMAPGQQVEVGDLPAELREPEAAAPATESDGSPVISSAVHVVDWTLGLAEEVARRLRAGEVGIIDDLTRRFEESCIRTGLAHTGGRKVEAAHLLGWGRNTLTRKIQELGMEGHDEHADHV
ncbi:nitrogen regulation protein NR(I) [Aquitalea magnusonii]|uniref:DNA-binding transcriptional regulator NtrC n=1 Tax=Aquitalea magnusonii TaxID=332411 RepID=A0A3G9GKY8_9NEIS|nr:nitrogen regulation protein NR(I) [Aquitalea magnusonii]BBF86682.1 nitrogen regulation protein NR(I) [Aquitalea magnusonii]